MKHLNIAVRVTVPFLVLSLAISTLNPQLEWSAHGLPSGQYVLQDLFTPGRSQMDDPEVKV